uniref:Uncharacterized protein n=1 Tax=Cucumis melo TaxID=3656 RepID=A0A9I9E6Z9_CUCME
MVEGKSSLQISIQVGCLHRIHTDPNPSCRRRNHRDTRT